MESHEQNEVNEFNQKDNEFSENIRFENKRIGKPPELLSKFQSDVGRKHLQYKYPAFGSKKIGSQFWYFEEACEWVLFI